MAYEDFNFQRPRYMDPRTEQNNPYGISPYYASAAPWGVQPYSAAGQEGTVNNTAPTTDMFGNPIDPNNVSNPPVNSIPAEGGGTIVGPPGVDLNAPPPAMPDNFVDVSGSETSTYPVNSAEGVATNEEGYVPHGQPGYDLWQRGVRHPTDLRLWGAYQDAQRVGQGNLFLRNHENFARNLGIVQDWGGQGVPGSQSTPNTSLATDAPPNMESVAPNVQTSAPIMPQSSAPTFDTGTNGPPVVTTAQTRMAPSTDIQRRYDKRNQITGRRMAPGANQASYRGGILKRRGGIRSRRGARLGYGRPRSRGGIRRR